MTEQRILGVSVAISKINGSIEKICNFPNPVLITGEVGTQKNLVAELIHKKSKRNQKGFIKFDALGVPKSHLGSRLFGILEADGKLMDGILADADGGTLLIMNVDYLPFDTQSNLMSIISNDEYYRQGTAEPIPIDIRLICTTEKNLRELINEDSILINLVNELSQFHLHIPPLRERIEDIPELVNHFVESFSEELSVQRPVVSTEFLEKITRAKLPGNVSELQNILKTLLVMSDEGTLYEDNLPDMILASNPDYIKSLISELKAVTTRKYKKFINNVEEQLLIAALADMNYNQVKVAQLFGVDESTLRRKMGKYGIPGKRSRK